MIAKESEASRGTRVLRWLLRIAMVVVAYVKLLPELFAYVALKVASIAAIVAMVCLLGIGLFDIYKAIHCLLHHNMGHILGEESLPMVIEGKEPLHMAVEGIEYLFLAPLAFLVVTGLRYYLSAMFLRGRVAGEVTDTHERLARTELLTAKGFTISLLAAAVATAMVGQVVSKTGITLERAAADCLVLISLVGLLVAVERSCERAQKPESHGHADPRAEK